MTHHYQITGMTCSSCEEKVKTALLSLDHVTDAVVSRDKNSATITMDKHISLNEFQKVLESKYQIQALNSIENDDKSKSWFETYKPILLIFFYIALVTCIMAFETLKVSDMTINQIVMKWMNHFMGGFFLTFSFFKLLNLKGFAESYVMYDVIAKKIPAWAYVYAFIELGLGIAYLIGFEPILTNSITFIVMSLSIIGVLQSVLNKKKIQCACLGTVFNLPMSTVTIIEDGLMIIMSGIMLVSHLIK